MQLSQLSQLRKPNLVGALGNVGVLMGGHSLEREVSLSSGRAVLEALKRSGINACGLDLKQLDVSALQALQGFDRVFIAMHGPVGEDGCLQGLLEMLDIPYTGSGVLASALAMDKFRSKQIWQANGLSVPQGWLIQNETQSDTFKQRVLAGEIKCPLMVKPLLEGSSLGMSKVTRPEQLPQAFVNAFKAGSQVLVESFLSGPEYTVGILQGCALPVIRIETERDFYDYQAKYLDEQTKFLIPSGLNAQQTQVIEQLALDAFNTLGCNGWGRVDIIADEAGNFSVIELNTIPGLTTHSLVPKACAAAQIEFDQLILHILDGA